MEVTWLVAAIWVLSGIAAWGPAEHYLHVVTEGRSPSTLLVRDIMRLIMMLLGPLYFVLSFGLPRAEREWRRKK